MRLSLFNKFDTLNDTSFQPITVQFTGPLILHADPNEPLHIATKRYVDNKLGTGLNASSITSGIIPGARLPAFTGDVTSSIGSTVFTLVNSGATAGNYTKFTVDTKGRITSGSTLTATDIPNLSWSKVNVGRPTTLAGYGITDAVKATGDSLVGTLTISGNPSLPLHAVNKSYVDTKAVGLDSNEATGTIIRRTEPASPQSYLRCNGSKVSKTTYAALYAVIGDQFGDYLMPGAGKPWQQQYAFNDQQSTDITGWTTGPSLPVAIYQIQAIVTKNRVYLLGGSTGGTGNTVYTAPINEDGTLGTWVTGTPLPGRSDSSQAIVTKNRVYLLGGGGGSTVYSAPINSDGTLGTWTDSGNNLPVGLDNSHVIVTKNRVYLLGGREYGAEFSSRVPTAPINEDGTLGTWTDSDNNLPEGLRNSQAIVTKNRVYLLGGQDSTVHSVSKVYTAPINTDGTLGTWIAGTSLPGDLGGSQAIVTKNRVYLLGGFNDSNTGSTVYSAPINLDGTLGTWTTGTSLPGNLYGSHAIVTKNRVYLLGGYNNGIGQVATVYVAPFSGGSNDYSSYYDGSIVAVTDPNNFRLPDYSNLETSSVKYFIKYN